MLKRLLKRVTYTVRRYPVSFFLFTCLALLFSLQLAGPQFAVIRTEPVVATPRHAIANQAIAFGAGNGDSTTLAQNAGTTPAFKAFSEATTATPTATPTPAAFICLPIVLKSFMSPCTPQPDLTVNTMRIELETGGACDYTSTQLGVRVWFQNIGCGDCGPFIVDVNGGQKTIASGLHAGQGDTAWIPRYVYLGVNTAFVDATYQVAESNEDNNKLSQFLAVPTLPPTCTPTPTLTPTATPIRSD
jgi:hypothetical protein